MIRQESAGSLREWVEERTAHLDVVASWESLCSTYEALRFSDPLADAERISEFRWIVQNMNSFMTKTRTSMLQCRDLESMAQMLGEKVTPGGQVNLEDRKALVYQKLRQHWVMATLTELTDMIRQEEEKREETTDGWPDRDADW